MSKFYDHPTTGKLHFSSIGGGWGGGASSEYDGIALQADIDAHPREYALYQKSKRDAAAKAKSQSDLDKHLSEIVKEVKDLEDSNGQ